MKGSTQPGESDLPEDADAGESTKARATGFARILHLITALLGFHHPATNAPLLSASLDNATPEGYRLAHIARTGMEADLLRQVLAEQGFEIPYVPSVWTGVVGQIDNPNIFVRLDQFDDAQQFLKEFLEAPLEGMDEK